MTGFAEVIPVPIFANYLLEVSSAGSNKYVFYLKVDDGATAGFV
jgi:hypothetical protein